MQVQVATCACNPLRRIVPADNSCVTLPGPWQHRLVRASGAQFHVASAGELQEGTPLVLLLHGFPQYWYAWRKQIPVLAEAGYAVAAMDVRGAGGSDRTRDTFDAPTLARDVIGVIRALGASEAVLVGSGTGGYLAWSAASREPSLVRGLVTISAPHPVDTYRLGFHVTFRSWRHHLMSFLPRIAEGRLQKPALLAQVLAEFSAPGNTGAVEATQHYVDALQLPNAAKTQVHQMRWTWSTARRRSGRRHLEELSQRIAVPVMTIRGDLDPLLPARAWSRTGRHVTGVYSHAVVPEAGHFVQEEQPEDVNRLLLDFLRGV